MKYKSLVVGLTAAEFLVTFIMSLAAVETYGCHGIFIGALVISLIWFIVFLIANDIIN